MAIDSKFLVLTKETLKNKIKDLNSSWTTILINGDLAYSKGADAGLANNLCVNADLLKAIITGNLRYEAKAEDNFLLDGDYYTLKNINGINVPYALKQVLDFIALLKKLYTVEFRDGSTVLSTLTIYWNSKVTKPTDPPKSGYTFTGWTPSWNFNTDTLNNKNQLDSSGKLIFIALWSKSSYTLTYYRNYPTGDTTIKASFGTTGNNTVKSLLLVNFTTPSGLNFSKWSTRSDGRGVNYNPGNNINITQDTDLYAIWEVTLCRFYFENNTGKQIEILLINGDTKTILDGNSAYWETTGCDGESFKIITSPDSGYSFEFEGINGTLGTYPYSGNSITLQPGDYQINLNAVPAEKYYYYRFVNSSNKAIDIYLDSWSTWNNTLSVNGSVNTGAISDSTYMLHIDTAPTSGYHWEISGPEGLYEYDETHGNTVYGSEDSSDPATYTISMVKDDTPSVEITCIEYSVTITAQDVAATATTANYSVTATKIIRYNNGTSSTQTIPASGYTVTGASFSANTDTTPKTKTISVSINNPDSNLCSGSVTTASTTFTLAAADEEPPTPTCSTYTYNITNNGATTLNVSGDISGDILAGETGTFTSSKSSITYSLLWSGSCKAEFSTLQDHYSYHGGSGTITLTYHEYRAPVISNGNTLTANAYPDCSASITHTPEYTVVNNPTIDTTNIALTLTSSLNSSISNNEIIDGYREYSYIISENSSTDSKDYKVKSLGLNCSDEKSGTQGGKPDFSYQVIELVIDSECNGGIPGNSKLDISSEYIKVDNLDANSIYVAGNVAENLDVTIYYYEGCGDGGEGTDLLIRWTDDNGDHSEVISDFGTLNIVKNGYDVTIHTRILQRS